MLQTETRLSPLFYFILRHDLPIRSRLASNLPPRHPSSSVRGVSYHTWRGGWEKNRVNNLSMDIHLYPRTYISASRACATATCNGTTEMGRSPLFYSYVPLGMKLLPLSGQLLDTCYCRPEDPYGQSAERGCLINVLVKRSFPCWLWPSLQLVKWFCTRLVGKEPPKAKRISFSEPEHSSE